MHPVRARRLFLAPEAVSPKMPFTSNPLRSAKAVNSPTWRSHD